MTTILALIIAVLAVALVAAIGWLAWDARRIEQECRADDDYPTDDELADWWDELADKTTDLEDDDA